MRYEHKIWMLSLFSGLFVLGQPWGTHLQAQVPVRSVKVERKPLQLRHAVTGTLRAVSRGNLAALEPGRLVELRVRAGNGVKKGDMVARVDARRLETQRAESIAALKVANAELVARKAVAEQTEATLKRARNLEQQKAISFQELDDAVAASRVASAEIVSATRRIERLQESIKLIDVRLEDTRILAPFDATVVERHVEPGDWVQPGDPLVTLVSKGNIEAWLDVPERFVQELDRFGDQIVIRPRATNQQTLVLETRRVPDVNPRARTIRFVATLGNPADLLAPGMSVDGWIAVTGKEQHTTIPKDALLRRGGNAYVYRVNAKSIAERLPVRVLFESPEAVAIQSTSLHVGDQVIVEGNERILPGQEVVATLETTAQPALVNR